MQKITPFLWFNGNVDDAAKFYTSAFKNSKVVKVNDMGGGNIQSSTLQIDDLELIAFNGGPLFKFTPATSFFVTCETEQEIDELWKKLGEDGAVFMELNKYPFSQKFGWVQDKFGLSWQLNLTGSKQKVTPFLMFVKEQNGKAEDAMNFYAATFKVAEILRIAHYGPGEGGDAGTVKHGALIIEGQEFMVMDSSGNHQFTFTPAISFFINCGNQEEVDYFWEKLSEGGRKSRCGWLTDKYGVSWQVIPDTLGKLMSDPDRSKAKRVMDAMMQMDKIDIEKLQLAYDTQ